MVSEIFSPAAGVPQVSVIAPFLLLIYVSRLPQLKAQMSQFDDDCPSTIGQ